MSASSSRCVRNAPLGLLNAGQTLRIVAGGATYCVTATTLTRNRRVAGGETRMMCQGLSLVVLDGKIELCAPEELCISSRVIVGEPMEIGRFIDGEYVRIDETDPVQSICYS